MSRLVIKSSLSKFVYYVYQTPPNVQITWKKRLYRAKQNRYFWEEVQNYKDASGLLLVKFDFVTGCQEVKIASVGEIWNLFVVMCFRFSWYFQAFTKYSRFFSLYSNIREQDDGGLQTTLTFKRDITALKCLHLFVLWTNVSFCAVLHRVYRTLLKQVTLMKVKSTDGGTLTSGTETGHTQNR